MRTPLFLLLLMSATSVAAQSFCFLQAVSYYEQLYCEINAEGKGQRLPVFSDFKKNNAMTQALLLKRPAARLGIKIKLPSTKKTPAKPNSQSKRVVSEQGLSGCQYAGLEIHCNGSAYRLVGNRGNKQLASGVLADTNLMEIPPFSGKGSGAVDRYLTTAYRRYIDKMLEIGLGGVTLSYGKFSYLYEDLREKDMDFSERFETMFGFLKKDKRRLEVDESVVVDDRLTLADCGPLSETLIVCASPLRNYVYQRETQ